MSATVPPSPIPDAARTLLARTDAALLGWGHRSLAPGREQSRGLLELCTALADPRDPPTLLLALAEGLAAIATAQQASFPDNLCCDFDALTAHLLRSARAALDPRALLAARCGQISRLQRLYGRDTAIRFRYVHDFVYGFDWAKWVARDPDLRAGVGPFDPPFLDHLERRAHALLDLIADDDAVYHALPDEHPRNPFPFSREPAHELALHRDLAARSLVPVAAWDPDATPVWRRPFAALRAERAAALGLMGTA